MSRFRPCIDLHAGRVKQMVGGTLGDEKELTNFVSERSPAYYAELYRADNLNGGHIIKLGPGNDDAAREALAAWPGGMHIGGGVNAANARNWLDAGAEKVIVTSCAFKNGMVDWDSISALVNSVGRDRLVLDLSCRKRNGKYFVVTDLWRKFTNVEVTPGMLEEFSRVCSEFLIHAVDVEGRQSGVDCDLIALLARFSPIPTTYAGGIRNFADIDLVEFAGADIIDYTVGSALNIFGGKLSYKDVVAHNGSNRQ
ncbi:MAG: phosphoribosylformimino-5-aminoimidazole carboxamide ribotide isomerase [Victivallaceae bacterium]|nr:phosphoribosylformimino-5-aminoimidazole carboxamide ribotide isomerase [Victivallaceae bacterium]